MYAEQRLWAVIPALNEEGAIGLVVNGLLALEHNGHAVLDGIVVCDNGSTDNTAAVAKSAGATVVSQTTRGYGIACLTAIAALPKDCDIVLFVDGDDSCVPSQAMPLINALVHPEENADLVIGSRTLGDIEPGALTPPQQFGNWLASFLIRALWQVNVTDLGPYRAIKRDVLEAIDMKDETFGWTVEMQVKAIKHGYKVIERPVDAKVRIGVSKISGTVKGTILAGYCILSTIATLKLRK